MDDVAAYGYVTPLRVKIVLALALTDAVVRDAEVIMVSPPPCFLPPPYHTNERVVCAGADRRYPPSVDSIDLQGVAHGALPSRLEPISQTRRRV